MILVNAKFGPRKRKSKEVLEKAITAYLAALFHNGQLCGEYCYTWIEGLLNAHVVAARPDAMNIKHHSQRGIKHLRKVCALFGREPEWTVLDDEVKKRYPRWQTATFFFLYADALTWEPPIRRGNDGKYIPAYQIPLADEERSALYSWHRSYKMHDALWIESGSLEIPVYKQLASPHSGLSLSGRSICEAIEHATGIPTYYYLMRYWGRREGEAERTCPGCGHPWSVPRQSTIRRTFWNFAFCCEECRLVSHEADMCDDERNARIGEYCRTVKKSGFHS